MTDAEKAAIGDTIFGLATSADGAVDRLDCEEGLRVFGDWEPLFVGGGTVFRTRPELEQQCEDMVAGRLGAVYDVTSSDAHVLSPDAAYLVREGVYTIQHQDRVRRINLVITGVWVRQGVDWIRVHFHESWQELDEG